MNDNDKKYFIIGEILICGICKKTYVDNPNDDILVCEDCKLFFPNENELKENKNVEESISN